MDNVEDAILTEINKITAKIDSLMPNVVNELAREIFSTQGQIDGRNWANNAPSTIKRKGKNTPNIDTGNLEQLLSNNGTIMEDNYMDQVVAMNSGYEYANDMRPFDDIGRTVADEVVMEKILEQKIQDEFK